MRTNIILIAWTFIKVKYTIIVVLISAFVQSICFTEINACLNLADVNVMGTRERCFVGILDEAFGVTASFNSVGF